MSPVITTKPKIDIAPSVLHKLETFIQEEGQVIVHCVCKAPAQSNTRIRIWKSTYLFDTESEHQSELVHAENISLYPEWQEIPDGSTAYFTLIFTGLPKTCRKFDLFERIPEYGGFMVWGIKRNDTDVYYVII